MRVLIRISALGALVALTLPLLAPLWWGFGLAVHFPLQIAGGSLALLVLALALRERAAAAVLTAILAVSIWQVREYLPAVAVAQAGDADLVVVALNLDWRNRESERVAEFLEGLLADVVVLPEYTAASVETLARLAAAYPHRLEAPAEGAFGIALLSRHPLLAGEVRFPAGSDKAVLDAVVDVAGRPLRVLGVHPPPPISKALLAERDGQLQALASLIDGETREVVVIGDFNDTPFSPTFRQLLRRTGLANASAGRGYPGSFPASWPPLWIPIDHCLYGGGLRPATVRTGPDVGSDHYPLIATFRRP